MIAVLPKGPYITGERLGDQAAGMSGTSQDSAFCLPTVASPDGRERQSSKTPHWILHPQRENPEMFSDSSGSGQVSAWDPSPVSRRSNPKIDPTRVRLQYWSAATQQVVWYTKVVKAINQLLAFKPNILWPEARYTKSFGSMVPRRSLLSGQSCHHPPQFPVCHQAMRACWLGGKTESQPFLHTCWPHPRCGSLSVSGQPAGRGPWPGTAHIPHHSLWFLVHHQ